VLAVQYVGVAVVGSGWPRGWTVLGFSSALCFWAVGLLEGRGPPTGGVLTREEDLLVDREKKEKKRKNTSAYV
jgi:hypothetical protein